MKTEEFVEKWNKRGGKSGLRVIIFNGGNIFADHMRINEVKKTVSGDVSVYDEVMFSKVIGDLVIETGACWVDKIKEVL